MIGDPLERDADAAEDGVHETAVCEVNGGHHALADILGVLLGQTVDDFFVSLARIGGTDVPVGFLFEEHLANCVHVDAVLAGLVVLFVLPHGFKVCVVEAVGKHIVAVQRRGEILPRHGTVGKVFGKIADEGVGMNGFELRLRDLV